VANQNAPFGFRPTIRFGGSPFSVRTYGKASTDTQAIFRFDICQRVATGVPLAEATGFDVPTVTSAYNTGAGAVGVGFWIGASLPYGAASTATMHQITDEPDVVYLTQSTGATVVSWTAAPSQIGINCNIDITTAGSTTTFFSGMGALTSGAATTPGMDLRIEAVAMISPNVVGADCVLEVRINRHYNNPGVVATPV
jgi:hypothetical protein